MGGDERLVATTVNITVTAEDGLLAIRALAPADAREELEKQPIPTFNVRCPVMLCKLLGDIEKGRFCVRITLLRRSLLKIRD